MNLKTFIFMMLTFREIYQIPRNIQTYLSITMWVLIASASFNKEEPCKECFFYDGHECQS